MAKRQGKTARKKVAKPKKELTIAELEAQKRAVRPRTPEQKRSFRISDGKSQRRVETEEAMNRVDETHSHLRKELDGLIQRAKTEKLAPKEHVRIISLTRRIEANRAARRALGDQLSQELWAQKHMDYIPSKVEEYQKNPKRYDKNRRA